MSTVSLLFHECAVVRPDVQTFVNPPLKSWMWWRKEGQKQRVKQRGGESQRLAKVMEWQGGWREEEEEAQRRIRWKDGEKGGVRWSKERPQEGRDGFLVDSALQFQTSAGVSVLSESREEKLQQEAATDTFRKQQREGRNGKICVEEVDAKGGFIPHSSYQDFSPWTLLL